MAFFDKFGHTIYELGTDQILVRDIIQSVRFDFNENDESTLFEEYRVQDDEKLENIAYNFYGSSDYHWVLALVNNILDQNNNLPKSDAILRRACVALYSNVDGIHHWESSANPGEWVDEFFVESFPVTNIEYMTQLNEDKRYINILKPIYLTNFVSSYFDQLS